MKVREIVKGRVVYSVSASQSVLAVAQYMTTKRIGAVTIVEGERPIGIFSERDLMERVIAAGRSVETTTVAEVMTTDLVTGHLDETHVDCLLRMQRRGCRHIPLVEADRLVGMLSLRDLLHIEVNEKDETIKWMNAYIHDSHAEP